MRIRVWPEDTIARRFAVTIAAAIVVALSLTGLVVEFAGVWARPPVREAGLLERANDIVRMVEAVPERERQALASAVANQDRPGVKFLLRCVDSNFCSGRLKQRGFCRYCDLIGDFTNLESEIQSHRLCQQN